MKAFDPQWEQIHSERSWGKWPDNHLVRFIYKTKPEHQPVGALDIGCGFGAQSNFMSLQGIYVTAIDASKSAIERCNAAYTGIKFKLADATKLPFDDSTFDLAVDVCCFQHIPEKFHLSALLQAYRVLKPNGLLFSMTAKWDHSTRLADTPLLRMTRDQVHQNYGTLAQFKLESLDSSTYSIENGGHWISHWIIVGRKA